MFISAPNSENENTNNIEIALNESIVENDNVEVGFNYTFILDLIKDKKLHSNELTIHYNSYNAPTMFEIDNHDYTNIIMPIKLTE